MNMINVRRLTVMTFLGASMLSGISAQVSPLQVDTLKETKIPDQWDLQSCIDYAKEQNITIRKNRITAASTQIDVKTAKAALFPSLSFSTSQQVVNRPYQETSSRVSGSEIISSNSKTSYNGNYGLNASWTLYNGNKRLKTIQQEKLNNQVAELDVATSENNIQESIAQVYIQILYAAESVKVNESTLQVSIAQRDRGQELLNAGSIAKSDFAQLEAQGVPRITENTADRALRLKTLGNAVCPPQAYPIFKYISMIETGECVSICPYGKAGGDA